MNQVEVFRKQIQCYSYIFGAVVLLMFGKMIGNNGIAYLAIAMETIGLFIVLLGEKAADVYGRMLRFRRKREQYQDAVAVRKSMLIVQGVVGIVFFLVVFLLADVFAEKIFGLANAALIIRILSPVLLLRVFHTLLIGYFQSFGAHMPAALACLLRQVLFLVLGKLFCGKLLAYGEKVAALLKNDDFYGMYGAVGLAVAIVVSEIVILIPLIIFYFMNDRKYDKNKSEAGLNKTEKTLDIVKGFYRLGGRTMGYSFLNRFFVLTALVVLVQINDMGIFYGKYLVICAVPVLLAVARYYLLYARLLSAIKNKKSKQVREKIQTGLQYAWSAGLLPTVLLAVLAPQLVNAYFEDDALLQAMLQNGCILVVAVMLLIYMIMVHMAHNRQGVCLLSMLGSAILFVILSMFMSGKMESIAMAVIYAGVISICVATLVLGIVTVSQYRLQLEYVQVFVLPLVCVGLVGVIVLLLAKFLTPHIGSSVCCVLGIVLGVILYLAALGFCRVFNESEIEQLYGKNGKKLLSVIFK